MILVWRFTVAATLCLLFKLKQIKPIKRHVYEHYLIQHSYSFHFLDSFLLEVLEERRQVNCLRASQWQDHAKTPHSLTHDTTIQLNTCSQRGNEKRPSHFCPRHIDIKNILYSACLTILSYLPLGFLLRFFSLQIYRRFADSFHKLQGEAFKDCLQTKTRPPGCLYWRNKTSCKYWQ